MNQLNSPGAISKTITLDGCLGKLIITEDVQNQIDYLHSKTTGKEWGGVFTYTAEGKIEDLANMVFTIQNIYLMDVGTYAHTGYSYEGFSKMYKTIPNTELDVRIGGLHSHHSMGAFFSGEDLQEIANNSAIYDYYLSLVVDTRGTYKAKVGIPVVEESKTITIKDGNGGTYAVKLNNTSNTVYVINVDVANNIKDVNIPAWFKTRFDELNIIKPPVFYEETTWPQSYKTGVKSTTPTSGYPVDFVCAVLSATDLYDALSWKYRDIDLEELELSLADSNEMEDLIKQECQFVTVNSKTISQVLYSSATLLANTLIAKDKSVDKVVELFRTYARSYSSQV